MPFWFKKDPSEEFSQKLCQDYECRFLSEILTLSRKEILEHFNCKKERKINKQHLHKKCLKINHLENIAHLLLPEFILGIFRLSD